MNFIGSLLQSLTQSNIIGLCMNTLLLINTVTFEEALHCIFIRSPPLVTSVSSMLLILKKRAYEICTSTFRQIFSINNPSLVVFILVDCD